jgi:hypothetical protein
MCQDYALNQQLLVLHCGGAIMGFFKTADQVLGTTANLTQKIGLGALRVTGTALNGTACFVADHQQEIASAGTLAHECYEAAPAPISGPENGSCMPPAIPPMPWVRRARQPNAWVS